MNDLNAIQSMINDMFAKRKPERWSFYCNLYSFMRVCYRMVREA